MFHIIIFQSIPSTNIPLPLAKPPGNFLEVVKAMPHGENFSAKHGPQGKIAPTPGEYFGRSSMHCLFISTKFLTFAEVNMSLNRFRHFSKYSLVILSSLNESNTLSFPNIQLVLKQIFFIGSLQLLMDQIEAEKVIQHGTTIDNLVLKILDDRPKPQETPG